MVLHSTEICKKQKMRQYIYFRLARAYHISLYSIQFVYEDEATLCWTSQRHGAVVTNPASILAVHDWHRFFATQRHVQPADIEVDQTSSTPIPCWTVLPKNRSNTITLSENTENHGLAPTVSTSNFTGPQCRVPFVYFCKTPHRFLAQKFGKKIFFRIQASEVGSGNVGAAKPWFSVNSDKVIVFERLLGRTVQQGIGVEHVWSTSISAGWTCRCVAKNRCQSWTARMLAGFLTTAPCLWMFNTTWLRTRIQIESNKTKYNMRALI